MKGHLVGEVGQSTRRSRVRRWPSWSEPERRWWNITAYHQLGESWDGGRAVGLAFQRISNPVLRALDEVLDFKYMLLSGQ